MSDIFISYAHEDRAWAHRLADTLAARGWGVWWDRRIVPGQTFDREIERELDAARAVVVLWSDHAVASDWVRNEAGAAQDRGLLVPALIGQTTIPLAFRRNQAALMVDWQGEPHHPGFEALCLGIARLLAGEPVPKPSAHLPPPPPLPSPAATPAQAPAAANAASAGLARTRPAARWPWVAAGMALLLALGLGLAQLRPAAQPAPSAAGPGTSAASPLTQAQGTDATSTPSAPAAKTDLASRVAGRYDGDIISDSQGSSRQGVSVVITRLDAYTVRIDSPDEPRLALPSVRLSLVMGDTVLGDAANTALSIKLSATPPSISYAPRMVLNFSGSLQGR